MTKVYSVKEVADLLGKHEETIKRWLRSGKLPNSFRNSDKEGWKIPESDLLNLNKVVVPVGTIEQLEVEPDADETDLVKLAYEAVTLTSPTGDILSVLSIIGIKRTLEILLIMQQSTSKVKNPDGFIKKAVRENWSPTSVPVKLPKKQSKRIYDLSQKDISNVAESNDEPFKRRVPFYNWLEE
ncbi:helix-turn-helix domain-containing protein [Bacillus sp. AFS055030]|uniref:helix-turn-helix domain-containing protein n=1 Tax=Bacillus sp. AFS055030 TaxID=2033507 RepID=UPI000BFBEBA6|nr:helix-turn-helix domain-containing protein [Bacillus sp. AFS055030]PGL70063.1 DNA-binding protein [Bacillus sp. AFS055030]